MQKLNFASDANFRGRRFMWLSSVTVLWRQRGWFSDTPSVVWKWPDSALPMLIYFRSIASHYVAASICATFYCIAHCKAFGHSNAGDKASDLRTPPPPPWNWEHLAMLEIYSRCQAIQPPSLALWDQIISGASWVDSNFNIFKIKFQKSLNLGFVRL